MALSKTEFELKLVGPASDIAAVPDLEFLRSAAGKPGEWERLVTTYFDSEGGRLSAAGLSLRVRNEADGKKLTAKLSPPGAGAFLRLETERSLALDEPPFSTGVFEIDRIIGPERDDLKEVAWTETDRWSVLVEEKGALVEVSAEIGRAERLGRERLPSPVAEVELELMKGDGQALFTLAQSLIDMFDGRLRLSTHAKLDRALRAGALHRLAKSERPPPPPGATASDMLALALKPIALRVIDASALIVEAHDGDAARQMRVALRRLRSLERIFRGALNATCLEPLAAKARGYAREIGAVRDLDVFAAESLPLTNAPPALVAAVDSKRAKAWNAAARSLSGKEFGAFALELLRAAMLEPWRIAPGKRISLPARQYADEVLDRRWEKLKRAASNAEISAPTTLHPLRLELKKFRYAAQFFRDLYASEARKPFFAAMSEMQDALGAVNDAVVAQAIAEEAARGFGADSARAAGFIAGYRGAQAAAGAAAAARKWDGLLALCPFWRAEPPSEAF